MPQVKLNSSPMKEPAAETGCGLFHFGRVPLLPPPPDSGVKLFLFSGLADFSSRKFLQENGLDAES
jgi:hypothetical protein